MLLVWNRDDDTADLRVGKHGFHIRHAGDTEFLLESSALFFRSAIARDNLELVRLRHCPRQHFGPPAEADDTEFRWSCTRSKILSLLRYPIRDTLPW